MRASRELGRTGVSVIVDEEGRKGYHVAGRRDCTGHGSSLSQDKRLFEREGGVKLGRGRRDRVEDVEQAFVAGVQVGEFAFGDASPLGVEPTVGVRDSYTGWWFSVGIAGWEAQRELDRREVAQG